MYYVINALPYRKPIYDDITHQLNIEKNRPKLKHVL